MGRKGEIMEPSFDHEKKQIGCCVICVVGLGNQKCLAGSRLRHAVVFEVDRCKSCRSGVPPFEGIGGDSVASLGLE